MMAAGPASGGLASGARGGAARKDDVVVPSAPLRGHVAPMSGRPGLATPLRAVGLSFTRAPLGLSHVSYTLLVKGTSVIRGAGLGMLVA